MPPVDIDEDWSPAVAEAIAASEQVLLDGAHWQAISCWRELAARHGHAPTLMDLSAACGLSLTRVNELFPGASEAILSRIAGVPE
jgi:tRNA 2-thiouridine synthesizing protein E